VTGVSWFEAAAYCPWAGIRLANALEWDRAARGIEGREYPWGNEMPDKTRANYGMKVGHPTPVGLFRKGATPEPEGVQDMAGNVWEWVADRYGETGKWRSLRGGSFDDSVRWFLWAEGRNLGIPEERNHKIGFRCVRGVGND